MADFNLYQSLWSNINDVCAPAPPPGAPAKAAFLMEMPGFSVDPDAYDPSKFDPTKVSPDRATALLCDRVSALAQYFYDTGSHISAYWEQFLRTFKITGAPIDDPQLKKAYDNAIKMLYGGPEGYINQTKTPLYSQLDTLRQNWQKAMEDKNKFWAECQQNKDKWPENFEANAGPYVDKVNEAYTEYDNLKLQIENYEAVIFQYVSGDLSSLMLGQERKMGEYRRSEAGQGGSAETFYKTTLEPADWWKWFKSDYKEKEGWTEVTITQDHEYKSSHDTYSQVSAETEASYGGLFYSGSVSGGFSKSEGNTSLSESGSAVKISFKVRKVLIQRPWLETLLLNYPTIGIKGLDIASWSTGQLEAAENKGQFPLLPTAFIVAKDVTISAGSYSKTVETSFEKMKTHAGFKVGIGCFGASGNYSSAQGSQDSKSTYDAAKKTLKIEGAQIIGWVCASIPEFPQIKS